MSTSDKNGHKNTPPEIENAAAVSTAAPAAHKDGDDKAWDRRMRIASCASFLLGCVWILLFPLVTLTTGESKPRGTFFDENAMLVHHTSTKLTAADVDWAKPARLIEAYPQQVKISRFVALFQQSRLGTLLSIGCHKHLLLVPYCLLLTQDGATGAEWVCTVLQGMDLPCYTHSFYERPSARSGLRKRYINLSVTAVQPPLVKTEFSRSDIEHFALRACRRPPYVAQ